ncbi:hypothetical protein AtNW77_Chr1g0041601 [Arabidopsis thaliana]|uniref:Uncharacterized protein n=1 Tax=Arabidopsis thaliana TaxID=3702 RepID=A0A178U6U6_ARATH|nr:hypothetical protein AXX17_ATUG01520 [Arabidopsis thaliana]OAP14064.1 hypothetical protein AXX17_AT1G38100 [Arabidopsis thaliana]
MWGRKRTLFAYHSSKYSMYAHQAKTIRSVYLWGGHLSRFNEPCDVTCPRIAPEIRVPGNLTVARSDISAQSYRRFSEVDAVCFFTDF